MLVVLSPIRTKAIHEVIDSRCTDELKISLREEASLLTYRLSKVEKMVMLLILYIFIIYLIICMFLILKQIKNIIKTIK